MTALNIVDEAMLPFDELVEEFSDHEGLVGDKDVIGITMEIEEIKASLPVQLDVLVDEEGKVTLGGSPPLFYVETSVMPIFHSVSFTLEKIEEKQ